MSFFIFLFLLFIKANLAGRPDFTCSNHIKQLANLELEVVQELNKIKEIYEEKLNFIKGYLEDFKLDLSSTSKKLLELDEMIYVRDSDFVSEVVKDPLKTFRLISRFSHNFPQIEDLIKNTTAEMEFLSNIQKLNDRLLFPNDQDMADSIISIIRLYQVYALKADQLSEGKILNVDSGVGLSLDHLYEIGFNALKWQTFTTAIEFLEEAEKQSENFTREKNNKEWIINQKAKYRLKEAYKNHDLLWSTEQVHAETYLKFYSKPLKENNGTRSYFGKKPVLRDITDPVSISYSYIQLCRGDELRPQEELSKLKCFLHKKNHPFWILNPIKVEVVNQDPPILLIHEVLTKNEIDKILNQARPNLEVARVVTLDGNTEGETSKSRVASSTWIVDHGPSEFNFFGKRIEKMIGLSVDPEWASEDLQIANYATGGYYTPHFDAVHEPILIDMLQEREFIFGDRICTFMIYLSDVELGGRTVFPAIGVQTKPVLGSALLWYNLHKDSSINRDTLHAGCPVLQGEKWVANKWIRSNEQMFRRKCPLDKNKLEYDLDSIGF